jgi:lysozyme
MIPAAREALRKMLIQEEGVVLHAYQDHLGYWTIGCGRLVDKRKGGGITYMEALLLLENDIDKVLVGLIANFPWFTNLDPIRQVALCAMTFQLGLAGVKKFTNTLAAMERGDYKAAARGMRNSLWSKQTPARVERLAKMMETGAVT